MPIPQYEEHNFKQLEDSLGIVFNNKDMLVQALVHRSFLNENRDFPLAHNERLEFLGDAVLELIVTEFLFANYLNPEGELTNWRAALVNGKNCALVGNEIGIEPYLFLSRGESQDANSKAREYIHGLCCLHLVIHHDSERDMVRYQFHYRRGHSFFHSRGLRASW